MHLRYSYLERKERTVRRPSQGGSFFKTETEVMHAIRSFMQASKQASCEEDSVTKVERIGTSKHTHTLKRKEKMGG